MKVMLGKLMVMKGTTKNNFYYFQGNRTLRSTTITTKDNEELETTMTYDFVTCR